MSDLMCFFPFFIISFFVGQLTFFTLTFLALFVCFVLCVHRFGCMSVYMKRCLTGGCMYGGQGRMSAILLCHFVTLHLVSGDDLLSQAGSYQVPDTLQSTVLGLQACMKCSAFDVRTGDGFKLRSLCLGSKHSYPPGHLPRPCLKVVHCDYKILWIFLLSFLLVV